MNATTWVQMELSLILSCWWGPARLVLWSSRYPGSRAGFHVANGGKATCGTSAATLAAASYITGSAGAAGRCAGSSGSVASSCSVGWVAGASAARFSEAATKAG